MMSMMEEAFLRFPHLGIQILENLDDTNLAKSRKVSMPWLNFIDSEELPRKRIQIQKKWQKILEEYPCEESQTKLLVALVTGQNKMFEVIFDAEKHNIKAEYYYKNCLFAYSLDFPTRPREDLERIRGNYAKIYEFTPYHLAAALGNLNACKMINT